jgi:hypothetical protein
MIYPTLPDEYQRLARVQRAHEAELLDKENVVGVALGNKYVNGDRHGAVEHSGFCFNEDAPQPHPRRPEAPVDAGGCPR